MKKLFLILPVIFILSCSSAKLAELGAIPKKDKTPYLSVLNKFTASKKHYEEFQTKALVTATFFSDDFFSSYSKEREQYSKPEDFNMFLDKEKFLIDNYLRFFISFYSPKEDLADLDKPAVWNIYLETSGGKKIYPHSVKKAEEPKDILSHYFPYLDYWSKPYFINFKKSELDINSEQSFTLNFVSVLGKLSLSFSY